MLSRIDRISRILNLDYANIAINQEGAVEDAVTDLLADLLHFVQQSNTQNTIQVDINDCWRKANDHFQVESNTDSTP